MQLGGPGSPLPEAVAHTCTPAYTHGEGNAMKRTARNGDATAVSDGTSVAVLDRSELLNALQKVREGDFSVRLPGDLVGVDGKIADTFNEIVSINQAMAQELERVGQVVGRE